MKRFIAALLASFLFLTQVAFAKSYSYIYIEGDKQTPFYVKLEGQMLPRLGKNYCIIPNLDEGITNIEILFQQNKFPPQKFVVRVPADGSRGFVLQKVNDRQFALYDMQQGIYLVSGNTADDDKVPAAGTVVEIPVKNTEAPIANASGDEGNDIPAFSTNTKNKKKKLPKPVAVEKPKKEESSDGRFISDIELNADGSAKEAPIPAFKEEKRVTGKKKSNSSDATLNDVKDEIAENTQGVKSSEQGIPNSDCKSPMSSEEFENFALKILDKTDDDARLKVLTKNKGKLCFTTEQVRIIANNLDTQSGRYEVARLLYAQTSDQSNYPQLESLFKTNYLKTKFREILNPKQ